MLAIIIPSLNSGTDLHNLLEQIGDKADRIVISDGISGDDSLKTAMAYNVVITIGEAGRGKQLGRGASWAKDADWLLFLHADSQLSDTWLNAITTHIENHSDKSGYFKLRFDSPKLKARLVEYLVCLRCFAWALPYGDQGLLMSRRLYDEIGGYSDSPIFEDVDIVEKIGRKRLRVLDAPIITSARKYEPNGFFKQGWRNLKLLRRYKKGESIENLLADYT